MGYRLDSCTDLVNELEVLTDMNAMLSQYYNTAWDGNSLDYCGWEGVQCGEDDGVSTNDGLSCSGLVTEIDYSLILAQGLLLNDTSMIESSETAVLVTKGIMEQLTKLTCPAVAIHIGSLCCGERW